MHRALRDREIAMATRSTYRVACADADAVRSAVDAAGYEVVT